MVLPQVRFNLSTFLVSTVGFYFHHPAPSSLWRALTPAAGACFTSPWELPRRSDWQVQEATWNDTEWLHFPELLHETEPITHYGMLLKIAWWPPSSLLCPSHLAVFFLLEHFLMNHFCTDLILGPISWELSLRHRVCMFPSLIMGI